MDPVVVVVVVVDRGLKYIILSLFSARPWILSFSLHVIMLGSAQSMGRNQITTPLQAGYPWWYYCYYLTHSPLVYAFSSSIAISYLQRR